MRAAATATSDAPTRGPRAGWAALALAALLLTPGEQGGAGLPGPSGDAELSYHVRRALMSDTRLTPLNLWVQVHRNVATLSGEVPSDVLRARAVELAGQVPGIAEVCDRITVVPRDGLPDWPSAFPSGPPAGSDLAARRRQMPRKADLPDAEPGPGPPGVAVSLGPPQGLGEAPPPPAPPPPPVSAQPPPPGGAELLAPRPVAGPPDLATAVEAVRVADDRFARVEAQVRGGTVFLGGRVARWADVEAMAALVRRLPGAKAVVLADVRVDRPGGQ